MNWYVAETHWREETRAQDGLRRLGFETRYPTYLKKSVIRNQEVVAERGLFGAFMFVAFDADVDEWKPICSTRGVKRLMLSSDGKPNAMRKRDADAILEICKAGPQADFEAATDVLIKTGQMARIFDGTYAGHIGQCMRTAQGRATILLNMFNRPTNVEVPIGFVKAVA